MSHADSPGRYPSAILVEYFRDDSWVRLEEMTMADPEFETLTDYPLSNAACSMVHNGGMPATMCTAEHPNSYYHSRACCSGQPSSDGLSCPSGDFIWCDGTNDPAMGTSKRQTCGSFVALAPAGGGHRRRHLQMFDFTCRCKIEAKSSTGASIMTLESSTGARPTPTDVQFYLQMQN